MKKLFILTIFLFVVCKIYSYTDPFNNEDLELTLEIDENKEELNGKLICKNISDKQIKIPKYYLDFYNSERIFLKSNWFTVYDENGKCLKYLGDFYEPVLKKLKSNVIKLKPGDSYEIQIFNLNKNYYIDSSKELYISYDGPLGESNEILYLIK